MVERVAEAILARLPDTLQYGSAGIATRLLTKNLARAAIEAMREPTEAMVLAACEEARREQVRPVAIRRADAAGLFAAMIDAALGGQP